MQFFITDNLPIWVVGDLYSTWKFHVQFHHAITLFSVLIDGEATSFRLVDLNCSFWRTSIRPQFLIAFVSNDAL